MELRVLRYFLEVAQEKNITHAARNLLISQPTLSTQLADLEDELGTKLFVRGRREIELTEEGEYLRARAAEIVALANKTTANIQSKQIVSGSLAIGAGESIELRRIMKILAGMVADYPDIKLHFISGNAGEMEAQLQSGVVDFAVFMGERLTNNYNFLELPEKDSWGVLMREDDVLAKKDAITPEDLLGLPLIVSKQALETQRFQKWWGDLDSKMNVVATFTLTFNAQLLASEGQMYLITFEHLVNSYLKKQLVFRPLNPTLKEPITIVWKKNTVLSKAAQLFIQRIKSSLNMDLDN